MDDRAHYEFVEGATSDLSFIAWGPTAEVVFRAAANAFLAATVEEPGAVERRVRRSIELEEPDLELLLMRFLNELVYLRDAEDLLLHLDEIEISPIPPAAGPARLRAKLAGDRIDRRRHALASDIKGATAHGLRVAKTAEGWKATATLDV